MITVMKFKVGLFSNLDISFLSYELIHKISICLANLAHRDLSQIKKQVCFQLHVHIAF